MKEGIYQGKSKENEDQRVSFKHAGSGSFIIDNRPGSKVFADGAKSDVVQRIPEKDKPAFLTFHNDLSEKAKNKSQLRHKFIELVKQDISLEEAKTALSSVFIPKEEGAAAAKHSDDTKDATGGSQEQPGKKPPSSELAELIARGEFSPENAAAFSEEHASILDGPLEEKDRMITLAHNKMRVEQHGIQTDMTPARPSSNFATFEKNISKFFPSSLPPLSVQLIASQLVGKVDNKSVTDFLLVFHVNISAFEKSPVIEDMQPRLRELIGPRLKDLPPAVVANLGHALTNVPAQKLDPFHYTIEAMKEELHTLSSGLHKSPPSSSAVRLAAGAIHRALIVSSGRFLPNQKKTIGKKGITRDDQERMERIMVHETIHAANEKAETTVENQLSHIFAEVFTEITANFILGTPPAAYQEFIPLGREVIEHVYRGDMKAFLTAFFSGDLGAVQRLFTPADIDTLRHVDADMGGLEVYKKIVGDRINKARAEKQELDDEMERLLGGVMGGLPKSKAALSPPVSGGKKEERPSVQPEKSLKEMEDDLFASLLGKDGRK